jgi:uncharacterized membrane protein
VRRFGKVFGTLFPLLLIGGFALAGHFLGEVDVDSGDKSFEIEDIEVHALLRRDGVLLVREQVTYDFDGTFNVGVRTFDSGTWQIANIQAYEGEEALGTVTDSPTLFEWDISPAEGEHTYELRYEVHNAVLAWPDVVELNWQWVGEDVDHGTGHHEVDLRLRAPEDADAGDLRAWAHGPLNGTIDVGVDRIRTQVDDLPPYTFLETRSIAPREWFDADLPPARVGQDDLSAGLDECGLYTNALRSDQAENGTLTDEQITRLIRDYPACQGASGQVETEPQADRIIAEETALAEQANADRAEYEREQQEKEDRKRALQVGTPFAVAIALALAFAIWRVWGKEPELPAEIDYWREVPDDPPAVAQAIMAWGYVDTDAFSATVVDLAQRGYLTIEEKEKDHAFTRTAKEPEDLKEHERMVLTKLFENGNETSQKQLTNWAKAHRTDAASWLNSFKGAVSKSYNARGYQLKGRFLPWFLYLLVVAGLALYGVVTFANEAYVAGGATIGVAVLILCYIGLLKKRTPKGAQRHAEWAGLKRFLKDFSQLEDAPSGHMALYERYLVAAVALDVADELVEALRVRIPEVANDPTFATWYVGSRVGGVSGFSSLGEFSSGLSSATASSFRPPPSSSSSSGGGFSGGFSGGGGGGGGGGGFGAR